MSNLNKVQLLGRLGKDPEFHTFNSGDKIARFSLATSEFWKDRNTHEKKSKTEWHNVLIQGPAVGIVEKYVRKGHLLYVEGKLTTREWETKEGEKKYVTEVVCREVQLMPNERTQGNNQSYQAAATAPAATDYEEAEDDLPY